MDFFRSQDAARRKTGILVVYFIIAVALMIVTLYVVAVGACRVEVVHLDCDEAVLQDSDCLDGIYAVSHPIAHVAACTDAFAFSFTEFDDVFGFPVYRRYEAH